VDEQAVIGGEIGSGNGDLRDCGWRRGDGPTGGLEIGNAALVEDHLQVVGERGLAGTRRSEMEQADIDATGPARITVTLASEKSVVRKRGNGAITLSSRATSARRRAFLRAMTSATKAW